MFDFFQNPKEAPISINTPCHATNLFLPIQHEAYKHHGTPFPTTIAPEHRKELIFPVFERSVTLLKIPTAVVHKPVLRVFDTKRNYSAPGDQEPVNTSQVRAQALFNDTALRRKQLVRSIGRIHCLTHESCYLSTAFSVEYCSAVSTTRDARFPVSLRQSIARETLFFVRRRLRVSRDQPSGSFAPSVPRCLLPPRWHSKPIVACSGSLIRGFRQWSATGEEGDGIKGLVFALERPIRARTLSARAMKRDRACTRAWLILMDRGWLIKKSRDRGKQRYFSVNVTAAARARRVPADGGIKHCGFLACAPATLPDHKISPDGLIFLLFSCPAGVAGTRANFASRHATCFFTVTSRAIVSATA